MLSLRAIVSASARFRTAATCTTYPCPAGSLSAGSESGEATGAVTGSIWLALKGRDRATPIPFGPYLAAAGWIQLFWGVDLLQAYLDFIGL